VTVTAPDPVKDLGLDQITLRGPAGKAKLLAAITDPPSLTRTIDGASTLTVVVADSSRELLRSGMFDGRSWAVVDGMHFELVSIGKSGARTTLTFEDAVVAQLRRQTDKLSIPAGSASRGEIARRLAKEADVDVAVDPGHPEHVHAAVHRSTAGEDSDSWTLLGQLADDIHWRRFSDGLRLVVGSDAWLMGRSKPIKVREHAGPVHDIDFDLDTGKRASQATVAVDAARWAVRPGQAITVEDCGPADGDWLVSEFTRTLTQNRATLTLTRARHVLKEPKPAPKAKAGSEPGESGFLPGREGTGSSAGVAANAARERMVQFALAQAGKPYVWGASGPGSYDCSGLVQAASAAAGKTLGKPAASQWATCQRAGRTISVQQALGIRGALLFRIGVGSYNHVAISLGNGSTIEAMGTAYGVLVAGNAGSRTWTGGALWL
jgi:cell wall-associated NlpC family hydrolase